LDLTDSFLHPLPPMNSNKPSYETLFSFLNPRLRTNSGNYQPWMWTYVTERGEGTDVLSWIIWDAHLDFHLSGARLQVLQL